MRPKYDTIPGIMKPKKRKPIPSRPIDNHYRTTPEEYELIARIAHEKGMSIADYTRSKLIPPHPQIKLDELRSSQRRQGDPDEWFQHPKHNSKTP